MLDELLRRLDSWAYLRVERQPGRVILHARDGVVGALNLASQVLSIDVPGDVLCRLLEAQPHLRDRAIQTAAPRGVALAPLPKDTT
jgi:hypothetical protein